jgi:hypothetical protein
MLYREIMAICSEIHTKHGVTRSRRVRCIGHVACIQERRGTRVVLVRKLEGKRSL